MDPQQQQPCAGGQVETSKAWGPGLVHGMHTLG